MAGAVATGSLHAEDAMLTLPQNHTWPHLPDGFVFPRSSKLPGKPIDLDKPLTEWQRALVLGTLLGDGHIAPAGQYVASHSPTQAEYCWTKYTFLSEYVRGQPSISKKNKQGYKSIRFWTAKTPTFASLRAMCYPGGIKTVSKEWLDLIDKIGFLPAVAWWIADDGTLLYRKTNKNYFTLMICTHGFQHAEVELLRKWLLEHGYQSNLMTVRRKNYRLYPVIMLTTDSSHKLMDALRPWTPPAMRYKLDTGARLTSLVCSFCGRTYAADLPAGRKFIKVSPHPCCLDAECLKARNRLRYRIYDAIPEKLLEKATRRKQKYRDDADFRQRILVSNKAYAKRHPETQRNAKRKHNAKAKEARHARQWECLRCHKIELIEGGHFDRLVCQACLPQLLRDRGTLKYLKKQLARDDINEERRAQLTERFTTLMASMPIRSSVSSTSENTMSMT
jgi:hypothetical protein